MLFCSILLHASLLFVPEFNSSAELSDQENATELRLTLARAQQPAIPPIETPTPEPIKEKPVEVPEPQRKPEPESEPAVKPVEKKKPEPVVSSHKPAEKKVVKREPQKEIKPEKKPVPKPEPKPVPMVPVATETKSQGEEVITQQAASANTVDEMKVWKAELQQRIQRNRQYPRQALRRGLEGDVRLRAVIRPDGTLKSAEMLSGHKSFKTSSLKTLKRSLPYPPPEWVAKDLKITFTIRYSLN